MMTPQQVAFTGGLLLTVLTAPFPLRAAQQNTQSSRMAGESRHWRCEPIQKWTCELPDGCEPADPKQTWTLLDFRDRTYQRCDRFGCDKYQMTVTEKGIFTYVNLPDHPDTFMKIGLANYFADVASQGVSVFNSLGVCKVQR